MTFCENLAQQLIILLIYEFDLSFSCSCKCDLNLLSLHTYQSYNIPPPFVDQPLYFLYSTTRDIQWLLISFILFQFSVSTTLIILLFVLHSRLRCLTARSQLPKPDLRAALSSGLKVSLKHLGSLVHWTNSIGTMRSLGLIWSTDAVLLIFSDFTAPCSIRAPKS